MSVKIGHASIDENKKAHGGKAGDQTGKEVFTRSWYSHPWVYVIRAKDSKAREKIAKAMEQACANNNIGYDQYQRTTLFTLAKEKAWDISKVATKCECDCSSLVAVCVNAAGISVSKDIYTGNQKSALANTGKFDIYTDAKYTKSDAYLMRGDILLGNGHTAIVLSNGEKVSASESTKKKMIAEIAKDVINGKYGTGAERKKALEAKGYNYAEVQAEVNRLLGAEKQAKKSNEEVAKEVIKGLWSTGAERKSKLEAAGYNYSEVQKIVNNMLK
ncbi:MAG: hypothetical protein J6R68_04150 [Clostridia bacterium]|nr:hypothetical protein [Clostridia bacterium]MBO7288904.1 hypothetical protein [Clostridia bacterium]